MKNSRFFSEFSLGLVIVLGLASAASAGNALLGLWRFNEAGGDVAINSSGLTNQRARTRHTVRDRRPRPQGVPHGPAGRRAKSEFPKDAIGQVLYLT
jgi:hypothetical protein